MKDGEMLESMDDVTIDDDQMNTDDNTGVDENGETPSNDTPEVNIDDVVKSWGESEARQSELEEENFKLKQQLADRTSIEDDDDLDEDEIINKKVEARLQQREAENKFNTAKIEREANYLRKTNPYFAKNEKKVLEFAIAKKTTITEAVKDLKKQEEIVREAQKNTKGVDKGAKGGSKGGSIRSTGGYDPKKDGNKSIDELFRENL